MKSMTGYGWGQASRDGWKITVETSSVNRKQSEIAVNAPRELEVLEAQIRDEVNRCIARGRVTVRVSLHASDAVSAGRVRVNGALAAAYARRLAELARRLKLKDPVSLDHLVRAPGVLEPEEEMEDAEKFWPSVEAALRQALAMMVKMREREGAHLQKDLAQRMNIMRRSTARVRNRRRRCSGGTASNCWTGCGRPVCPPRRWTRSACSRRWCCLPTAPISPRS